MLKKNLEDKENFRSKGDKFGKNPDVFGHSDAENQLSKYMKAVKARFNSSLEEKVVNSYENKSIKTKKQKKTLKNPFKRSKSTCAQVIVVNKDST